MRSIDDQVQCTAPGRARGKSSQRPASCSGRCYWHLSPALLRLLAQSLSHSPFLPRAPHRPFSEFSPSTTPKSAFPRSFLPVPLPAKSCTPDRPSQNDSDRFLCFSPVLPFLTVCLTLTSGIHSSSIHSSPTSTYSCPPHHNRSILTRSCLSTQTMRRRHVLQIRPPSEAVQARPRPAVGRRLNAGRILLACKDTRASWMTTPVKG